MILRVSQMSQGILADKLGHLLLMWSCFNIVSGPLESEMTGAESPTGENSKKRQSCDSQHDSSAGDVGAGGGQLQNSSHPDAVKHSRKKKGKTIYPYGNYNHYYNYRVLL